ncbi:Dabb family protein [Actibacterium lipolyticum]|uniref:Stress responsive A/B Barrel Domain protein n=1 Tax=Actibacterium lipolyticum TaxID=1524263 RepID=A0A238L7W3_9RHOB|nr:Dabb family protein [Actibacterium lipolyticum]SMX51193.1 Stress responsive A/B Barrel Domain protein [Actibacterium lipolyticum]
MTNLASSQDFIRHIVFFSSKDPADISRVSNGLSMLANIPSVRHFEVGTNLNKDNYGNEVDVIVYAEFEDEAAMQAYRNHPIYEECVRLVRPLREMRFAADFKSAPIEDPASVTPA